MSESGGQKIVQQLIDNATDIIAASTNEGAEKLVVLANCQKTLTQALKENTSHLTPGISRATIEGLQDLVEKAMDAVKAEMGQNRGNMQTTGIKKKVLRAYGTVTVSDTPSE